MQVISSNNSAVVIGEIAYATKHDGHIMLFFKNGTIPLKITFDTDQRMDEYLLMVTDALKNI